MCVLWIDQFLGRVFTSPFWALSWRILGKCAGSCVSPIMWWQAVPQVTNEPITTLQWRRQVNPLSNHCVQCPLPCSNYPGSDGTFSSNSPPTPADMYLGHCQMSGSYHPVLRMHHRIKTEQRCGRGDGDTTLSGCTEPHLKTRGNSKISRKIIFPNKNMYLNPEVKLSIKPRKPTLNSMLVLFVKKAIPQRMQCDSSASLRHNSSGNYSWQQYLLLVFQH